MAHSRVCHGSFTCVSWLIHMCVMARSHVCHGSFTCVSWLTHMCVMAHLHVCHGSFTCVSYHVWMSHLYEWVIYMNESCIWMSHLYEWVIYMNESSIWTSHLYERVIRFRPHVHIWMSHRTHMNEATFTHVPCCILVSHSYVCNDSFIYAHVCDTSFKLFLMGTVALYRVCSTGLR